MPARWNAAVLMSCATSRSSSDSCGGVQAKQAPPRRRRDLGPSVQSEGDRRAFAHRSAKRSITCCGLAVCFKAPSQSASLFSPVHRGPLRGDQVDLKIEFNRIGCSYDKNAHPNPLVCLIGSVSAFFFLHVGEIALDTRLELMMQTSVVSQARSARVFRAPLLCSWTRSSGPQRRAVGVPALAAHSFEA
jgi:hypothetical protein